MTSLAHAATWDSATALLAGTPSVLDPAGDRAETIEQVWWILFAISAVVFAVVAFLVLLAVARRSGRPLRGPEARDPLWARVLVLVGGVAFPAVVLVGLFALTVDTLPAVSAPAEEGELTVEVEGMQWFWDVRYPEEGIVTANEIHIPVGTPVEVRVTTGDVIHSFWVPQLNRKIDLVPGKVNSIVLEADRPGVYRGQCAEFCGVQHANMAFFVIAEPRDEFEAWAGRMARPPGEPADEDAERGRDVFLEYGCGGCHTIEGTEADGELGPDLTHLGDRRTIAAGTIPNTRGWLAGWVLDPQHVKPGNRMPGIDIPGEEFQALLDYLESLE
ncbi:MAG TPA: cytochrome c oxidase subunit II [Gaiellaceae bacterium]|nr:cytochrome c oxidase subunit II [Gaiellaceae bacterium]